MLPSLLEKLNPGEKRKDWIFVLDLASTHRAAEFRAKVPKHIHIVYIPAQSISYCQPCDVAMFRTWKSVLAAAANELRERRGWPEHQDHIRLLSHAPEEKKRVVRRKRRSTFRTEPTSGCWRGDMSVGNQMKIGDTGVSDARRQPDQPADAPAAGCDTIDEHTIFDLDNEEEPEEEEEEEEDEGAAAPSSSSVTGAAIKHKRTMDKFLALRIVYGKGPKG